MKETQETINAWQAATFPDATASGIINHLKEEFQEFVDETYLDSQAYEAADLIILLYAWARSRGINLHHFVDTKMEINRRRDWNIQPDGTGRHK